MHDYCYYCYTYALENYYPLEHQGRHVQEFNYETTMVEQLMGYLSLFPTATGTELISNFAQELFPTASEADLITLQGELGQELDGNIGNVSGLREEAILLQLNFRAYHQCDDKEGEICVVCQSEYEDEELMGGLVCGHEYHVDCIKKWLLQKNSCPICKRTAIQEHEQERMSFASYTF